MVLTGRRQPRGESHLKSLKVWGNCRQSPPANTESTEVVNRHTLAYLFAGQAEECEEGCHLNTKRRGIART